jgi:hypothetical protein
MPNNLFISYDLHEPGKQYDQVSNAIKQLGDWAKVHYSLWYVKSQYDATQAVNRVWAVMDANDKLLVVNATNNSASWQNLDPVVAKFIVERWNL